MEREQNWRDISDCRSLGSNYRPCSQSRKISIGVMVDSFSKTRTKKLNEDVAAVPTAENITSSKGDTVEDRQKGKGVTVPAKGKQTEVPDQENSPWVSTRSFHQKVPSSEEADISKQASCPPAAGNMLNRSNGIKEALATHSVQFFENQVTTLQSGDGNQKRFYRVTNGREGWIDGAPTNAEKALVLEKEVIEKANKTENMGNETLRVKLWEILGTVSSPSKQRNSQALVTGTNNLKSGLKSDEKGAPVVKPRQNSNAVGNDSGSPSHLIRRPVTRSLSRTRSTTKVQQNKMKNVGSYSYKDKHRENNIFLFEEGCSGRLYRPLTGGSSVSKIKDSKRKSSRIKPHKLSFHEHDNACDTLQASDRSKTKSAAEKSSSSHRNTIGNSPLTKKNIELVDRKNGIYGKDSHPSPVIEITDQLRDASLLQKNMDQREELTNPSLENVVDSQDDLQSPTFKMKTTITSSPGSPLETSQHEQDDHGPAGRVFNMERIRSFQSLLSSKSDYYRTNAQMESSGNGGELEDSSVAKSVPIMRKSHTENRNSKSSSEASDSESSEDCSPVQGYKRTLSNHRKPELLFPEMDKAEKPMFVFHPAKRHRNLDAVEVTRLSPTSGSLKGTEERFILHEPSELDQEDGLASAVALFALALERVKRKMSSITSKKSAEILMSVAKEIHMQLQNAESQIQTDVGKLTSLGKTKRKRLETRFQEQQEQLKVIHERFKQEVNQHIQDCRGTLEGLEACQMEFKGTVEKQKASHRKLLLQAEEAMETQLNDAQRRITTVHKVAREKMIQLKYVIAEFLKDGLLN